MKIKLLVTVLAALALAGCDELEGQLNVTKSFSVVAKGKTRQVSVGNYKTELEFKRDRVEAEIDLPEGEIKVNFAVPDHSSIPANGNFELKSAQTGQPIDVLGQVQTVESNSDIEKGWLSCQYQSYEPICGPQGCTTRPVTRWGRQYAEYYFRNIDKTITMDLTEVGSKSRKFAKFSGASRESQQIIVRQGICQ